VNYARLALQLIRERCCCHIIKICLLDSDFLVTHLSASSSPLGQIVIIIQLVFCGHHINRSDDDRSLSHLLSILPPSSSFSLSLSVSLFLFFSLPLSLSLALSLSLSISLSLCLSLTTTHHIKSGSRGQLHIKP
jgi:hypothetical protein